MGDEKPPKWGALIPNRYGQKEATLDQTCSPKPNKIQGFLTRQETRRKLQWKRKQQSREGCYHNPKTDQEMECSATDSAQDILCLSMLRNLNFVP